MTKNPITFQEKFWKGKFGSDYIGRHETRKWVRNNQKFFVNCLKSSKKTNINSLIEFGSNVGLNIIALNKILKLKQIYAIEINSKAFKLLKKLKSVNPINSSVLNFKPQKKFDLVLSKGFLIHINPKKLNSVYEKIFKSCKKNGYILICEYYSPKPESVNYRGNTNVLFKRDFAGEILDKFKKKIKLLDCGFSYHREKYPQGDITWFLLQKI